MDSLRLTARAVMRRHPLSVLIVMPTEQTPEEEYVKKAIQKFREANPDTACEFSLANFVNDDQVLATIVHARPALVVTLGTHLMRLAVGVAATVGNVSVERNHGCLQHAASGYLVYPLLDAASRCRVTKELGQACALPEQHAEALSRRMFTDDVRRLFEFLSQKAPQSGAPTLGA